MNVINRIINNPEKLMYGMERLGLLDWMSNKMYIKLTYRLAFGRKLDLENPMALTEKINWYKLFWRNQQAKTCADKYEVRKYVEKTIGGSYLNSIFGIWNSPDDIDQLKLPDKFVLKPTNGSGDVIICKDKKSFDWDKTKQLLMQNHKRHFSSKTKEWTYYDLPYRILGERYIVSSDENQIKDYKFFCFHGEPKFLFVASERGSENLKFDFFDLDWNWLSVTNAHEHNPDLKRPEHFEEMIDIARKLAHAFPHVRVDLYEEEGRVFFGELTFYHFGGFMKFEPDSWDFEFGKYFDLSKIPKGELIKS